MNARALLLGIALAAAAFASPLRSSARAADALTAKQHRALFRRGAELWPIYCNTCHNARPGSEFSPSEWQMIIMHMRTQANLPAEDAQAVLEFLRASR